MDTSHLKRENVMLTHEMAQKLNNDPTTQVMEYEYDTPEQKLSMSDVVKALDDTRREYTELKQEHRDWDIAQLRRHLVDHHLRSACSPHAPHHLPESHRSRHASRDV